MHHHAFGPAAHDHLWQRPVTRGEFLRISAGAVALTSSGLWAIPGRVLAAAPSPAKEPRPVSGGIEFGPGGPFIHIFPPDRDADPSSIGDFDGLVGAAIVRGKGTGTDLTTGKTNDLLFDSDMRFMQGTYRAVDGSRQTGSFVFI